MAAQLSRRRRVTELHFETMGVIAHMYEEEQLTAAAIGTRLFMSESAVYRHLDRARVPRRPPGRRPLAAEQRG